MASSRANSPSGAPTTPGSRPCWREFSQVGRYRPEAAVAFFQGADSKLHIPAPLHPYLIQRNSHDLTLFKLSQSFVRKKHKEIATYITFDIDHRSKILEAKGFPKIPAWEIFVITATFADRIVNIATTGPLVRLELGALQPPPRNKDDKPQLVPAGTLVMPLDCFTASMGMMDAIVKQLVKDGVLKPNSPAASDLIDATVTH